MALASAGHAPADDQSDLRGHYALLQLSPDAELELVEQVYWHLAFKYHREGLRHELQRLNRAMAAVLSALGQGDAPRPTTSVAVGGRWGSVSRLAWDIWWLGASLAAPALAMGLTLAVVSPGGDLQALGRWQGVLLGSGAAGLGTLAAVAVLAAVVPPTVRSLGRRSTAPPGQTDHYAVLHLDPAASRDVVEVAYAHLAKAAGTRGDSARLSALQEAYRVLGDADRRAAYDGQRAAPDPPRPPTLRQRPRPPRAPIGLATKAFRGIAGAALAALLAAAQGLGRGWRALRPPMADAWRAVTSALRARAVPAASRSPQGRRSPRVRLDLPAGPTRAKGSTATMAASRSAPPSARLTVLEGPLAGKAFHLRPDAAVTIGPGPDCDIVLGAAPGVTAARIARIWPREDRFMLHVLASELPAFVQDHPLVWVVLEDGDLLELGPYRLRFEVIR